MRVPPPKELSKSLERRRSSDESAKPVSRRSINTTTRSSVNTSVPRRTAPMRIETKPTATKSDDSDLMKNKIASLEEEIRRLKRRIEELEKEIVDLHKQIRTKDKRIAELTKENEELKKRVRLHLGPTTNPSHLSSQESNYQKQVDDFRSENQRLNSENQRLEAEVHRLQSAQKSAQDSHADLDALREHVRLLIVSRWPDDLCLV